MAFVWLGYESEDRYPFRSGDGVVIYTEPCIHCQVTADCLAEKLTLATGDTAHAEEKVA